MRILVLVLLILSACAANPPPPRGAGLSTCDHLVNDDGHLRMVRCCLDAGC